MTETSEVPRRVRGERSRFFDEPAIDQVYAVVLAAAELQRD